MVTRVKMGSWMMTHITHGRRGIQSPEPLTNTINTVKPFYFQIVIHCGTICLTMSSYSWNEGSIQEKFRKYILGTVLRVGNQLFNKRNSLLLNIFLGREKYKQPDLCCSGKSESIFVHRLLSAHVEHLMP